MKMLAAALALLVPTAAAAEDSAAAGRAVLAKYGDAVVTVRLVIEYSMTMGGRTREDERKTELLGVVLDPSGLTAISLTAIDPTSLMKGRMRGNDDFKMDASVKDAKLLLGDGSEVPVAVVLRDKDLDLAFLRPYEAPKKSLPAVDLKSAAVPQVLDEVVCLNRLGKVADRTVAVSLERIDAVVHKPQNFYVMASGGSSGVGSPVFALSGAPVGVVMIRNVPEDGDSNAASMFNGSGGGGILPIVVPAADILEDARQALAAKPPKRSGR